MLENRDFKGVWIPKEIWLNKELTLLEKAIYTEIDSLDNENHCTAGNEYFAEFCDCSESKVSKAIKKLQDLNMIEIISFDGRRRKIAVLSRVAKNAKQSSKKYEAESQKVLANNIDNKTNSNSIISKDIIEESMQKRIDWFIQNYHNICVSLPKVKAITDKRKKAIKKLLNSYSEQDIIECFKNVEDSSFLKGNNDRGWKADLDFILREDKFIAILEGKYTDSKSKKKRFNLEGNTDPYTEEDKIEDDKWREEMKKRGIKTSF